MATLQFSTTAVALGDIQLGQLPISRNKADNLPYPAPTPTPTSARTALPLRCYLTQRQWHPTHRSPLWLLWVQLLPGRAV